MDSFMAVYLLMTLQDALDARSSVHHTALSLANAYMHCGTASDQFLRDNLEWLGRASNWSKFSATAALGVIHKGNLENGKALLDPYLPGAEGNASSAGSQYQEGGALYALGLINAGHGSGTPVEPYLIEKLKAATQEPVQHGAALGLGIAGLGSANAGMKAIVRLCLLSWLFFAEAYESLKVVLYNDSAVAGEAAGLAMGLIMLGQPTEEIKAEMLLYAHETQHEKIIRGLAMGVAFLYYGRQEEADQVVKEMCADGVRHNIIFNQLFSLFHRIRS
jgi:26S proteasome regulatory subunit N2